MGFYAASENIGIVTGGAFSGETANPGKKNAGRIETPGIVMYNIALFMLVDYSTKDRIERR